MSEGVTQAVIPLAALIGIVFALTQWFLVSKVKVLSGNISENGSFNQRNRLIVNDDEEVGVDPDQLVFKCAEIQKAISVGNSLIRFYNFRLFLVMYLD